jgi:phosphohistidine swiveling domain-containing protein
MSDQVKLWDEIPGYDFTEAVDVPAMHSWFLDGTHSVPPWTPLFGWFWIRYCSHGTKAGCEHFSIPTCKGWEMRIMNGGSYNAFNIVRDESEIADREKRFRVAMRPWIEDFDGLWGGYKKELLGMYAKLKEVDLDNASNLQLYHHSYDLVQMYIRMWEIHFLGMYATFNAWLLLETLLKERFGITDQSPEFQNMVTGFDNKVYQIDHKMWEFGQAAIDMGLGDIFRNEKSSDIIPKLQETSKGKEWVKGLMDWMKTDEVGGWRMRRMNEFTEPYWLEDPSTPVSVVKGFLGKGTEYSLDSIRKELDIKREKAIEAMLDRIGPAEREVFAGLIKLAGKSSMYSEEHDLYCELYSHALIRRGFMAIGKRLAERGAIDKQDDIFFLNPDEIDRVMMVPEAHDVRYITRRRRAAWEQWCTTPNPPLFTDRGGLEQAVGADLFPSMDAIAIKVVVGELPEVKPELGADLFGLCGCPGEAEGIARVINYYEELKDLLPGEILVCPGTSPDWTPVFGRVKAVLADRGGLLSHAAIIGREYGVPTLVNTFEGTAKIKTGMRIRVDADKGAIYILDKKA